jgi:hypothetical protein
MKTINLRRFTAIFIFGMLLLSSAHGQNSNGLFFNISTSKHPGVVPAHFGLGYERALNNSFSAGFTGSIGRQSIFIADSNHGEETLLEIGFIPNLRFYPLRSSFNKFFVGLGAGYSLVSISASNRELSHLFRLEAETGWNFTIRRMFLQPSFGYALGLGKINRPRYLATNIDPLFKYGFINFGLSIGFVF